MAELLVAALYRFVALPDYEALRAPLLEICAANGVSGSLLLADEGINGTIAGSSKGVEAMLAHLRRDSRFQGLELKFSSASEPPFDRMKVRLKREIVTMGVEGVDPTACVGTYVDAKDWNSLIDDPGVLLVDTRNEMEIAIGTFRGAINPGIASFREFPAWMREQLSQKEHPKVAMFCTGGIRCEKSTAFLRQSGFEEVYHLKGGILKYLEEIPESESRWEGQCYVFDKRVSVGHGLAQGPYGQCYGCGNPISEADRQQASFEEGVSCPHCIEKLTPEREKRLRERVRHKTGIAGARATRQDSDA